MNKILSNDEIKKFKEDGAVFLKNSNWSCFILLKKFSRDTISLNGNSIESAIDGVNVSTNPENPKKIPIFILSSELELETEVNK